MKIYSDHTIDMNLYYLKGAKSFDGSFPLIVIWYL